MTRAPLAIARLWNDIHAAIPQAELGGIVGDVHHSFGYHLARNDLPSGDYSCQLPADHLGASDCASALDVSLNPVLMKAVTRRLLNAARAGDPRLRALREFCGTLDGSNTYPWDVASRSSEGLNSWDDSHLWHVHLSFLREYADNYAALAPIALVIAGVPLETEFVMDAEAKAAIGALSAKLDLVLAKFEGSDLHPHTVESTLNHVVHGAAYHSGQGRDYPAVMTDKAAQ